MADIFGRAQRVIVFLGEEADSSDLAIETIKRMTQLLSREEKKSLIYDPRPAVVKATLSIDESTRLIPETEQAALEAFFTRPWFCRLWVYKMEGQIPVLLILGLISVSKCQSVRLSTGNLKDDRPRTELYVYLVSSFNWILHSST